MKKTYFHLSLFLFLTVLFTGSTCFGGDVFSENSKIETRGLQIDLAQFKSDRENLNRLEIYYRIFNNLLQFVKEGEEFAAAYEVSVSVHNDDGRQVNAVSRSKNFTVSSYEKTVSDKDFRTSQFNLLLAPGKYKIDFALNDRNTEGTVRKSLKVNLEKYDNSTPQCSGIEFAQAIDTALYDSLFIKGNKTVVPSVQRQYGGDSTSGLLYYVELYQGIDARESVKVETQIFDRNFDAVYRDTMTAAFADGIIRQIRQVSLSGIRAGDYILAIALKGRRDRVVEELREPFSIYWSADALVRNDFEAAVMQLKYIASAQEMDSLKKAKTPEDKLRLWKDFWFSRDPSPGTAENEFKKDYYRRIDFANRHFDALKREGWLSDRGMVYISHGEPDQIEDYPFELDRKAYQVWYYYHSENVRRFVFVDEWNDGDYRLQYPFDGVYR